MKKIVFGILAALFISAPVLAVSPDQMHLVLQSGATGTTVQIQTATRTVPVTVDHEGCDIISSPTVTVTVLFRGGNGYGGTYTFDSSGLASATTCTTGACNVQFAKTLRAMDALITAATSTAVITVTCTVK